MVITWVGSSVVDAITGSWVFATTTVSSNAGGVAAAFAGGAAAALFMALRMHRLDLRRVAILAFAVAALGDLASAFLGNNATLFLPVRLFAGIGAGAAYTAAVAAFARLHGGLDGQILIFFVMAVAAAEAAVGLAIIIAIYRKKSSTDVDEMNLMRW